MVASKLTPPPVAPPPRPTMTVANHTGKIVLSPRIVLDIKEITGKSIAIMGTNGSGKSGTTRKLCEEHIAKKLPFTLADIENEYATLKELGEVLLAGPSVEYGSVKVDIKLTNTGEFHEFGRKACEQSLTVVLLLGDLDDETRKLYLKAYLDGVFDAANNPRTAHYYRVFLEEVQEYIPQVGLAKSDPLRQSIIRFGKRGRKRKLSLVLISQRPSNVDKDVLTQCHLFVLHFVTYSTDIDVYQNALGIDNAAEKMKSMKPGDAIYIFGREQIEDRISRPKTVSPWDEAATFDPSKFQEVRDTTTLQQDVERGGAADDGMSVVQSVYLHKLENDSAAFKTQIQGLVDTQVALEQEMVTLKARVPTITVASTGDETADELRVQLAVKQRELDRALAEAMPIRLLVEMVRSHPQPQ